MVSLERLRGLIFRGITGASKSLPTKALGALMGLEPLHLTIIAESGKAAWRIGENTSSEIKETENLYQHREETDHENSER